MVVCVIGRRKKAKDAGPKIIEENEVVILVDDDWDENLLESEIYLILFYKFLSEYERAVWHLIEMEPFTPLTKVDFSSNS